MRIDLLWMILSVLLINIQRSSGQFEMKDHTRKLQKFLCPQGTSLAACSAYRARLANKKDHPDLSRNDWNPPNPPYSPNPPNLPNPPNPPIISTINPPTVTVSPPFIRIEECKVPIKLNFTRVGLKKVREDFVQSSEVTELYLCYNKITRVSPSSLNSLPKLEVLDLTGNNISLKNMLQFDGHYRLKTLRIDENECRETDATLKNVLEPLPNLQVLSLRDSCIQNFDVDLKTFTPELTSLDLSKNRLESSDFLVDLPSKLARLHLDDNSIQSVSGVTLKTLEDLSVSGNKIEYLCGCSCKSSNALRLCDTIRLQKLNASRNAIGEVMKDALNDLKRLTSLDLSGNRIKELTIGTFNGLVSVRELYLSRNELTSIPHVCAMSNLKVLDLSYNKIEDIAKSSFCSNMFLETLLLADNKITNVGGDVIPMLQYLRKLDLSNNFIFRLPVELITYARSLEVLWLKNNTITGLEELSAARSNTIKDLHLQDNPILSFKMSWIRPNDLPQLEIHVNYLPVKSVRAASEEKVTDNDISDEDGNDYDDQLQ